MLNNLQSQVVTLSCKDCYNETSGPHKWSSKAEQQLEKLTKDSNLTAGLEAVLHIAVGARVMLRRSIDTSLGLVNVALGTVTNIMAPVSLYVLTIQIVHTT